MDLGHGPKCNRAQREGRLVVVEDMMYRRLLASNVIQRVLAKEWGITTRTVRKYQFRVRERARLATEANPDPRITRESLTETTVNVLNLALDRIKLVGGAKVADPDLRTALRAVERLQELHGLRVVRHELTGKDGAPLAMSPEQAAEEMRKVVEEIAGRKKGETGEPAPEPDKET